MKVQCEFPLLPPTQGVKKSSQNPLIQFKYCYNTKTSNLYQIWLETHHILIQVCGFGSHKCTYMNVAYLTDLITTLGLQNPSSVVSGPHEDHRCPEYKALKLKKSRLGEPLV